MNSSEREKKKANYKATFSKKSKRFPAIVWLIPQFLTNTRL